MRVQETMMTRVKIKSWRGENSTKNTALQMNPSTTRHSVYLCMTMKKLQQAREKNFQKDWRRVPATRTGR